ncbi:hypothetical protein HOJ01_00970 [bacterium]|jgi:hypothetical protein|nr:hypothetical protein [bacterium]MBT6293360.1 hypothetical protein [bacterium]
MKNQKLVLFIASVFLLLSISFFVYSETLGKSASSIQVKSVHATTPIT